VFIDLGKCAKKAVVTPSPKASNDWQKGMEKVCWTFTAMSKQDGVKLDLASRKVHVTTSV
jgi:hypothetical protein